MAYDVEVESDIARLRESRAFGAAFHMARLSAENAELRRRLAAAELILSADDLDAFLAGVDQAVSALAVVVTRTETGRRYLRAVP